jgi:hypothetical protein
MLEQYHKHYKNCHQRRFKIIEKDGICCKYLHEEEINKFDNNNKGLSTWSKNDSLLQCSKRIQNLSIAANLLIQRASPLIPVVRMKN